MEDDLIANQCLGTCVCVCVCVCVYVVWTGVAGYCGC